MQKRPRSWSNHEHFVLDVQLLIYRAAYNFCVDLPLTLESVNDDKFAAANQLLDAIGAPQLTKEEVLAKAFPAFELSGDRLTWFAREKLPAMRGQAADVISLLTLPYENTYPSSWFSGELAKSRFLELEGGEEGEEVAEQSPRVLAIVLSQALISGVVSTGGEEIEGLEGLEEWELGDEEKAKPVLASAADISKCEESSWAIWIGEGEDADELELSVAAKLINDLTLQKPTAWVLTRLQPCTLFARSVSAVLSTFAPRSKRCVPGWLQTRVPVAQRAGAVAAPRASCSCKLSSLRRRRWHSRWQSCC